MRKKDNPHQKKTTGHLSAKHQSRSASYKKNQDDPQN